MGEYTGSDRRRFKRVKVSVTVVYRKDAPLDVRVRNSNFESEATMLDISEGGMALVTNINIPISTIMWVRFTLTKVEGKAINFYGDIELLGKVCNSVLIAENSYRIGIQFIEVKEKVSNDIRNFVNALENSLDKKEGK
jgi:c-di-GMP-binding flagellar brake protein YcgR